MAYSFASLWRPVIFTIILAGLPVVNQAYASSGSITEQDVANADRIVIGMVTDKELLGDTEEVWVSVYEWLKSGHDSWSQIILDTDASRPVELEIGEEVLLLLEDRDVVNGHFAIYLDSEGPAKYPIAMKEDVVSLARQHENSIQAQTEVEELEEMLRNSDTKACRITEFAFGSAPDKFLYCSHEDAKFYVPINVTLGKVRQELLKHVPEQYFIEHFDLKRAWDEAVVNGHAEPSGQTMEFEYTIGNFTLHYPVHARLGFEEDDGHLLYLQFVPPREITDIAVLDESQIARIIYASGCLPAGTPFVLYDAAAVPHVDRGFSPYMGGRGPPDVFDRSGNQVREADKRFNLWLETGEIGCTASVTESDEIDASIGRSDTVVLMDASEYLGFENPIQQGGDGQPAEEQVVLVGTSPVAYLGLLVIGLPVAAIAVISFWVLRKRGLIH